jgi:hypothetical protein
MTDGTEHWKQCEKKLKHQGLGAWVQHYKRTLTTAGQGEKPSFQGFSQFMQQNPLSYTATTKVTPQPDPNTLLIEHPKDPKTFASVVDPLKSRIRHPLLQSLSSINTLDDCVAYNEEAIQKSLTPEAKVTADKAIRDLLKYYFIAGGRALGILNEDRIPTEASQNGNLQKPIVFEPQSSYFKIEIANTESIFSLNDQWLEILATSAAHVAALLEKNIPETEDRYNLLVTIFEDELLSNMESIGQWISELSASKRQALYDRNWQSFVCPISSGQEM